MSESASPSARPIAVNFFQVFRQGIAKSYGALGLLIPMSVLSLYGAALLQEFVPRLRAEYTWLQPFRVLRGVFESKNFPLVVGLSYALGTFARLGRVGLTRSFGELRRFSIVRGDRTWILLRAVTALSLFGIDWSFFPAHSLLDALALSLFGAALIQPWPRESMRRFFLHMGCAVLIFTAVCYWFTVVKALTFAWQPQRDAEIIAFERAVTGVTPHRALAAWASESPRLVHWFDWAYLQIFEHMALTTAFLFGLGDLRKRTEYLAALAICYFLGGPLYLLFPASGPAYFDSTAFSFLRQQDLAVNYVQAALLQNTALVNQGRAQLLDTWSYIACMPSLHLAHESVMLYYTRDSKLAFSISLAFTAFSAVAVVVLGWHYPTDVLAGIALAVIAIGVARWQSERLMPARLGIAGGRAPSLGEADLPEPELSLPTPNVAR